MVSFQINKDTREIARESYKGEILESLQNHQDVSWAIQSRFFDQRRLFLSFVQSFKWFYKNLQTFKNSGRKKSGKMLQPQVNSRNPSAVHHNLLKLCYIRQQAVIRWRVENFKSISCNMGISQMNKDTKEIAHESYI